MPGGAAKIKVVNGPPPPAVLQKSAETRKNKSSKQNKRGAPPPPPLPPPPPPSLSRIARSLKDARALFLGLMYEVPSFGRAYFEAKAIQKSVVIGIGVDGVQVLDAKDPNRAILAEYAYDVIESMTCPEEVIFLCAGVCLFVCEGRAGRGGALIWSP